ncbi:MAG: hypothetical protein KKH92_08190 [Firmicutes bacterium]|nr:hypothetical protein [Bacillota bacterium]
MSFAFWASSVTGNIDSAESSVVVGDWYDGTPIYTISEFIDVITTDGNTGSYVLARNLDFNNITPAEWIQTKDIRFMGSLDGLGHSISNITLSDYRGIFGILDGATIKNITLNAVNINYTLADNYTSGILAGRMQGTGNLIENVRINNSSISNTSVFAGGLVGFVSPTSGTGTATISNVKITGTSITGGYSGNGYGNGGLFGTVNTFNMTIDDVYVEATVTSNSLTSSGGLIGSTLTGTTVAINRAVVFSSIIVLSTTNDANVGSGGLIGRNQGTASANDVFYTGFLRAYVTNPTNTSYTVRAGTLRAAGNNITFTNSRSSQITIYRRAQNPSIAVNTATLYNKLTGQKATHSAATYVKLRTSLNAAWWTTNYSAITNLSLIWEYNATTRLYQLKD